MKILILGAKGNLGTQLNKVFSADRENEVIAWDREQIDVTDEDLVNKKVEDLRPDIIINAVAYTAVDRCEESEEEYDKAKELNIDVPRYLAKAALENKALFIHYSTDYVFDGEKEAYDEKDEALAQNRYGKTKLHGEKAVLKLSGEGLHWYLIRTSKLFGPRGENENAKPSFFDTMLKLAREKEELDLVDGEKSCFTYTCDLAEATKKLVDNEAGYGIYHLVNEGPVTWYDGAKKLFELTGTDIKLNKIKSEDLQRPAKRPKSSVLLNTKAEKLRRWEEGLSDYLKK